MSDSLVEPAVLSADWFYALVGADYEHGGLVTMTIDQVWSNQQYREVAAAALEWAADFAYSAGDHWSTVRDLRAKAREVRGG